MELAAVRMPASSVVNAALDNVFAAAKKTDESKPVGDFADLVTRSLSQVGASQNQAESLAKQYQLGQNDVSLEDAMISMQKANIGFQATVQVRNKLVSAYNDVMNMPL